MTANQLTWLAQQEQQRANRAKEEETKRSNLRKEALQEKELAQTRELEYNRQIVQAAKNVSDGAVNFTKLFGGFTLV